MGNTNSPLFRVGSRVMYTGGRNFADPPKGTVSEAVFYIDQFYYAIEWDDGFRDHTMRSEQWLLGVLYE
jgi:hypothetical protein